MHRLCFHSADANMWSDLPVLLLNSCSTENRRTLRRLTEFEAQVACSR